MQSRSATDSELLRRYAEAQSEDAFGALVERHLGLVYSAAYRQLSGNDHAAQDIAQAVFTELARHARALQNHPAITGWLYTTTHHLVCRFLRTERRRIRWDQDAHAMHSLHRGDDPDWSSLRPILDDALRDLRDSDRVAVLLRFFQGRDLRSIGAALGVSEDAARMRIDRALERLQGALKRRGITATAAALASTLAAHAIEAVPSQLPAVIAVSAVANAAATGTGLGIVGAMNHLTQSLGTMKAPILTTSVVAVLSAAPLMLQHNRLQAEQTQLRSLRKDAASLDVTRADHDRLAARAAVAAEIQELRQATSELPRLQQETVELEAAQRSPLFAELGQARSNQRTADANWSAVNARVVFRTSHDQAIEAIKHLGLAARIYANDHRERFPGSFKDMAEILGTSEPGGLPLDQFEFFPQPRAIFEVEPQLFIFREKQPRQRPDGRWERIYGLADGSAQTLESEGRDFSAVEQAQYGIASPEIPENLRNQPAYQPDAP